MTNQLPDSVRFQDSEITIIDYDGKAWLTGAQIGHALGYRDTRKVSHLFQRNCDEFTDDMTTVIKQGRTHVRIFSAHGAHLIAMFARTERAKAFRRWVLDVLEGKVPLPGRPNRLAVLEQTLSKTQQALLKARPRWVKHRRYAAMGLSQREIARLLRISRRSVQEEAVQLRELGLFPADVPMIAHRQSKLPLPDKSGRIAALERAFLTARPRLAWHRHYAGLGLNQSEVGRVIGVSEKTARTDARELRELGLLPTMPMIGEVQ